MCRLCELLSLVAAIEQRWLLQALIDAMEDAETEKLKADEETRRMEAVALGVYCVIHLSALLSSAQHKSQLSVDVRKLECTTSCHLLLLYHCLHCQLLLPVAISFTCI